MSKSTAHVRFKFQCPSKDRHVYLRWPTFGIDTKMCTVNDVDSESWRERTKCDGLSEFTNSVGWFLAKSFVRKERGNSANVSNTFLFVFASMLGYITIAIASRFLLQVTNVHLSFLACILIAASVHLLSDNFFTLRIGCEAGSCILILFLTEQITYDVNSNLGILTSRWTGIEVSSYAITFGVFVNAANSLGFRSTLIVFECLLFDILPTIEVRLLKDWDVCLTFLAAYLFGVIYKPLKSFFESYHSQRHIIARYDLLDLMIFILICFLVLAFPYKYVILCAFPACYRLGSKVGIRHAQQTGFLAFGSKKLNPMKMFFLLVSLGYFLCRWITSQSHVNLY